jgi:hypothetical protein
MKAFLIGLTLAVLFDAAAFGGTYRDALTGATVRVVKATLSSDWSLTHT